jgi:hypothetical protein
MQYIMGHANIVMYYFILAVIQKRKQGSNL